VIFFRLRYGLSLIAGVGLIFSILPSNARNISTSPLAHAFFVGYLDMVEVNVDHHDVVSAAGVFLEASSEMSLICTPKTLIIDFCFASDALLSGRA